MAAVAAAAAAAVQQVQQATLPSLSNVAAFVKQRGRKSLEFTTLIKAIGESAQQTALPRAQARDFGFGGCRLADAAQQWRATARRRGGPVCSAPHRRAHGWHA